MSEERDRIQHVNVGAASVSEDVAISPSTRNETQDDSYNHCDTQEAELSRDGEFMPKVH